ncbi:hypothetical protein [Mesorhizobium sp. BHbdii]
MKTGEATPVELTRMARGAHDEFDPRINATAVIEFCEGAETVASADAGPFTRTILRKDVTPERQTPVSREERHYPNCHVQTQRM